MAAWKTSRVLLLLLALLKGSYGDLIMDPDEEWLEVTTASVFNLKCTGDEPIRWEYPPSVPDGNKTSSKFVQEYDQTNGKYVAVLEIKNAHYMDTGFYQCSSTNYTEDQQIYLYVRDAEHLLAIDNDGEHVVLTQQQYDDLIIPCRPTSYDVNVTLYRDSEEVEVPYDSKKGFTIKMAMLSDSGYYECTASRKNKKQSVEFAVTVLPRADTVSKPIILVEGYENGHIIVGQDIVVLCYVIVSPGVQITLDWEPPSALNLEKVTFSDLFTEKIEIRGSERRKSFKNLEIKNVSTEDQGTYTCRVSDHSKNSNEEQYELEVFPVDMKYLNLSMEGKSEIQVRTTEHEATWIVNVEAYPKPILMWYGPDNDTLPRSEKYTISYDTKKTKIVVHDISIDDSGVYTLRASNAVKNETFSVTLLVEAKPTVSFVTPSRTYYDINKEEEIECLVKAYPIPKVEWFFTECTDYETFCAPGHRVDAVAMEPVPSLENKDYVHWHSKMKWYARESGMITVKAKNDLGVSEEKLVFKVTDVTNGFDIWGPKHRVLSSDSIVIGCGASIYEYESEFSWIYLSLSQGKDPENLNNSTRKGISITTNKTSFSYQTFLYLSDVNAENSGTYKCRVKSYVDNEYREKEFKLLVQRRVDVAFTNYTMANNSVVTVAVGRPITWNCSVSGLPEPELVWKKDDKILVPRNERIYFDNRNQTLHIMYAEYDDAGVYRCEASNGPGTLISVENKLKLKGPAVQARVLWWIFLILGGFILFLLLALLILYGLYKNAQKKKKELISVGLYNFSSGRVDAINPNVEISEQAEFLPYDKKWEFPRDNLKLGKQLGCGAFGIVLKAEAKDLFEEGVSTTVAVKMVKQTSDISHIKALATELKIMAHLGQHLNVVNLLGACTEHVNKRELLVIVEYCKFGNLHKYLLHHRNTFINQIDPNTGQLDFSGNRNEPSESGYVRNNTQYLNSGATTDNSNGQSVQTDMTSLSTPVGEDGYLMNRDVIADYQGDYKLNTVKPIATQDLLCWAFQVAKGMEYLSSRKILHGDLAARNVLLATSNVVKISDFGLAKNLYSKEKYENKKRNVPLPVKWMSIESIRDGIFSTQSDIWSFGVLLWELFSLAITPYPGLYGEEFYNKLLVGHRMEKPKYATEDVYNLMRECWQEEPMLRPSFTECAERLGVMLRETVKEHYLELNSVYLQNNYNIPSENDYLSKLVTPSYENCLQTGMPDGVAEGYVCMKPPKNDAMNEMELRPMITPGSNSFLNPGYQQVKNFTEHKYSNVSQDSTQAEEV